MKIAERNGIERFWDSFWVGWTGAVILLIGLAVWKIVDTITEF
ncbi:MAG: hypothetical protein GHCLOJNM_00103 [bacterium]|nr:hypothetical protein [bacterium]